jgi:hypothetical protein
VLISNPWFKKARAIGEKVDDVVVDWKIWVGGRSGETIKSTAQFKIRHIIFSSIHV